MEETGKKRTPDQVRLIRQGNYTTDSKYAKLYNMTVYSIRNIRLGVRYREVGGPENDGE